MLRILAIFSMAAAAVAQTGGSSPEFEGASVKLLQPTGAAHGPKAFYFSGASQLQISGTRVAIRGNLMGLVAGAYGLEPFQVSHGPDWTDKWATSDPYDIEARAPGDAPPTFAQVRQMMQTLLAERFHLKVTRQTAVTAVYVLVVAPSGAKIEPTKFADEAPRTRDEGSAGSQIRTRFLNYSMADLVRKVMFNFDRPLLDKTGLAGGYDFSLAYTAQPPGMTAAAAATLGVPEPEPGIPIVASLREQLGLRVVARKEAIETLAIVHAERPSEN